MLGLAGYCSGRAHVMFDRSPTLDGAVSDTPTLSLGPAQTATIVQVRCQCVGCALDSQTDSGQSLDG